MSRTDVLDSEYQDYCEEHNLPEMSADELLCELSLKSDHAAYLQDFINRYENAQTLDYENR